MNKLIYAVGNFNESGQQVIVFDYNAANKPSTPLQKKITKSMPEAKRVLDSLYVEDIDGQSPDLPAQGDVIWTETSGRKWVGHMLIYKHDEETLNEDALRLCIRSVYKKAKELKQDAVSMPLVCAHENKMQWLRVYPIIEEEMKELKTIVWVPDKEYLADIMTLIPGQWSKFSNTPFIRFKQR